VELSKIGKGPDDKAGFFLNIFLQDKFIEQSVGAINQQQKITMGEKSSGRVLVDFSSPNIAKNMHVGHLRSTIQGDSICRIFEFLGLDVKRTNHVGDWGTQFGMLIQELNENFPDFLTSPPDIGDLQLFYQNAKKRFDADEEFRKKAHENVVKLQSGDKHCLAAWKQLCDVSRQEFQQIYDRLDIRLEEVGESFYNPFLAPMVEELKAKELAVEDQGALCIFVGKKKSPPVMVQKSDGGFGYASTDLAAIRYRANELKCDRVVYVTDVGQELHFKQVFEAAEKVGFVDRKQVQLDHMMFGMVLQESVSVDEQGKEVRKQEKIKTREGKSVKLKELLDEAKARALQTFRTRIQQAEGEEESKEGQTKVQIEGEEEMESAAEVLGLSSVKYFDLRQNRIQNYVFSFDQMLDPKGNTGVYLIYSYVRICSILRKAEFN
jgi:arginyl-tRNA synthetase